MEFDNAAQMKAFMKKEAARLGITVTNAYSTYFARLLLERISKLSYDKLYVKGSFSLLTHTNTLIRPVTDIDIVSVEAHNYPILTLYQAMYDSNKDKADKEKDITFELTDIPKQKSTGIYKIKTKAQFDTIIQPIILDFQESSKTIYIIDKELVPPLFEGDKPFYIYTPTLEEHLAEKLCIALELSKSDVLNTRVKDFYDIWKLLEMPYDEEKLSKIFASMICDRGKIDESEMNVNHLDAKFVNRHEVLWYSLREKLEFLDKKVDFADSVYRTREILEAQIKDVPKYKHLIKSILPTEGSYQ